MHRAMVLVLILCAYAPAVAASENSALVAVSAADKAAVVSLQDALEAAVAAQHWTVDSVSGSAGARLAKCATKGDKAPCVAKLFSKRSASVILFVRVAKSRTDDGEPRIVLHGRLIDAKTGNVVGAAQRHCIRCHDQSRLARLGGELATELIRARASQLAPHTGIKIVATPSDALVVLNGTEAGPAGQTYNLPPGPQTVVVKRAGYESVTKQVDLRPNQELVLEIELASVGTQRTPRRAGTDKGTTARRYAPWLVAGASVVSMSLGITWLVQHTGPIDGTDRRPRARDSRTHGIVATAGGVVLGATAAYLFYRNRQRDGKASVTVAPTTRGGMMVWSGSF